jgi:hypothetical protein
MPVVEVAESLTEFFGIIRGAEGGNLTALKGEIEDLQVRGEEKEMDPRGGIFWIF